MNKIKDLTIVEKEVKQRAFDGAYQTWAKVLDTDNAYTYATDNGGNVTLIPECWIVLDVNYVCPTN